MADEDHTSDGADARPADAQTPDQQGKDKPKKPSPLSNPLVRFGLLTAPSSKVIQTSPVHTGLTRSPEQELDHLFARLVD